MEGHKSIIGKDQMRQYMGGLYENSMVIYREYLQNACDAVEQALQEELIQNRKQANIAVSIDTHGKRIIIHDVGIGISRKNIPLYLVDVASSQKFTKHLVGRHGIGRLNGANYCDKIIYETSFAGEPVKSTLIWDVKEARRLCNDDAEDIDTPEIIDRVTHLLPEEREDIDAHYCRVILENINDPNLMDEDAVRQYISEIVSVDYSLEFKDVVLDPALDLSINSGFAERFKNLWVYEVTVNEKPVEKTYQSVVNGKHLGTLQCFTLLDDKTQEELAWGWFALNRTAEQLNDLPFSYIRARHHNFQIGDADLLNKYHKSATAPAYSVGELHITHPGINPTATRDGIEGGPERRKLETALRKQLVKVYDIYNKASKFRSEVIGKVAACNTEIARLKLASKAETDNEEKAKYREQAKKKVEEKKTALNCASKYQEFFESHGLWAVVEDIVEAVNESTIEPFNNRANVQKADGQIPELKISDFKPSTPKLKTPKLPNNPGGNNVPTQQHNLGGDETSGNTIPGILPEGEPIPQEPVAPNEMDDYKSLSSVERALVKKFLSVINSMAELPEKQKIKIKTRLRKKIIR